MMVITTADSIFPTGVRLGTPIKPATKPNMAAAVNFTAGQILAYGVQPIITAYPSSSRDYTVRFEDVCGAPFCERKSSTLDGANTKWQKIISASAIEAAFVRSARSPGSRLRSVKVSVNAADESSV